MSVRYCMPSKCMRADRGVRACAAPVARVSPSAVTHRTHAGHDTVTPCRRSRWLAWKTLQSSLARRRGPEIDVALARRRRGNRRRPSTTPERARRSHSASIRSSVPSIACSSRSTRSDLEPHHDRLRLRVAQPAVEFKRRADCPRRRSSRRRRGIRLYGMPSAAMPSTAGRMISRMMRA